MKNKLIHTVVLTTVVGAALTLGTRQLQLRPVNMLREGGHQAAGEGSNTRFTTNGSNTFTTKEQRISRLAGKQRSRGEGGHTRITAKGSSHIFGSNGSNTFLFHG